MEKNGVILMQRYELGRMLGQGSFAKVYHARSLATGQSVAVKIIDKEKVMRVGMIDQIKREISVMRLVRHPNVVQLHEVMASKSKIYFVMEYVKGGELFDKIAKGRLKEGVARRYFQQLVGAVDFCHSRGVYHRDLKPENLLLDENGNLKITDFGLSALKESQGRDGLLHTTCGTPAYVAPEIINERGYEGAKADIWSCGVVLFVLLAGYLPFDDPNLMQMYRKVTKADFKCPSWFSSDVRRLLHRILDPNPATRITIEKLVQSHWFKKGYEPTAPYAHHQLHPDSSGTDLISDVNLEFMADDDDDDDDDDDEGVQNQEEEQKMKPTSLNAFDIISLSPGFDLSGLFENATCTQNRESLFMSQKPAADILSKFEEIAETEHFRVNRKDGLVKLQGNKEGRKGQLAIDAEIFEVTPSFYVVEVKKAAGDTLEYQNFCNDNLKPSLKDIAWSWQRSDQLPPLPPLPRSQI